MTSYPDSRICIAAAAYARQVSTPVLYNHVMRTFACGELVGSARSLKYDREVFFAAAVLHDLGLSSVATGAERFEIGGADAAKEFLARNGIKDADIDRLWDAIALHTTVGLPSRRQPEIALVQIGAGIDVGYLPVEIASALQLDGILEEWPRLNFKQEFPRLFASLAKNNPRSLASHVTAEFCERVVPGFKRPHICDVIQHAGFSE